MKTYFKSKYLCTGFVIVIGLYSSVCLIPPVTAQPFINSLAVLFRARPPWPTTFPSGSGNTNNGISKTFQVYSNPPPNNPSGPAIPAPLMSGAPSQQGILVAHPLPPQRHHDNFRKPPRQNRHNFGPHSKPYRPHMFTSSQKFSKEIRGRPPPLPPVKQNSNGPTQNHINGHHHPNILFSGLQQNQNLIQPAPQAQQSNQFLNESPQNNVQVGSPPIQMVNAPHASQVNQFSNGPPQPPTNQIPNGLLQPPNHNFVGSPSNPIMATSAPNPNPMHLGISQSQQQPRHEQNQFQIGSSSNQIHDGSGSQWNPTISNSNEMIQDGSSTNQFPNGSPSNQMIHAQPLMASASSGGNPQFPELPSSPQFQSMIGGELPPRYIDWRSNRDTQSQSQNSGQPSSVSQEHKKIEFRPSPQLLDSSFKSTEIIDGKLASQFQGGEAKRMPKYESGFRPISFNQFDFAAPAPTTSTTTSPFHYHHQIAVDLNQIAVSQQYNMNPVQQHNNNNQFTQQNTNQFNNNFYNPWSVPVNPIQNAAVVMAGATVSPYPIGGHQVVTEVSNSVVTTDFSVEEVKSNEASDMFGSKLASSSERVEEWTSSNSKNPKSLTSAEKFKFPVYKKRLRPIKCEKHFRYGFCPVTTNYPLDQVNSIASRCSALLAHLIAPLPKTDVHYDIIVTRNGSFRGRTSTSGRRTGWSWKDYRGKPVCDTEEIKIVPGWAKNEDGNWLVILQTPEWKQETQVSICAPPGPHSKCYGASCEKGLSGNFRNTKCVQRFTAQRLAVLDPESPDRCPVIRSVFLPSACVCLTDGIMSDSVGVFSSGESAEAQSSSEQINRIVLPPLDRNVRRNETYMIVSEKFSTKESTSESTK